MVAIAATVDLVVPAWLRAIGIASAGPVLPSNESSWASTGFVQTTVVGGTPSLDYPLRKPVIQIDCWAVATGGGTKAPWGKANDLAETIINASYNFSEVNLTSAQLSGSLGITVAPVRVLGAWPITEPRRLPDDVGSLARTSFDLNLVWAMN